MSTDSETC